VQVHKLSLVAVAREQMAKAGTATSGRAAETVYGGHERLLRQTVISLASGRSLAEHENPGEATVHVLSGRVRLTSSTTTWEGRAGDLIHVPQERHSLEAVEDSAVLLTVVKVP
jgi:quercetin dioxygenase-like cupin family protein